MQMWLPWQFILDEYGDVREYSLQSGFKYRLRAHLGPESRLRIVDTEGNSRVALHNSSKDWAGAEFVFTYTKDFGGAFAVQCLGKIDELTFTIDGVDFSEWG